MRSVSLSPTPPKFPLSPLPCVGSNAASVAGLLARTLRRCRQGTHKVGDGFVEEEEQEVKVVE